MDKSSHKYDKQKEKVKVEAQKLSDESNAKFAEHQQFSYGVACFQIGIVLASVSILVAGSWLFFGSVGMGAVGLLFCILAFR